MAMEEKTETELAMDGTNDGRRTSPPSPSIPQEANHGNETNHIDMSGMPHHPPPPGGGDITLPHAAEKTTPRPTSNEPPPPPSPPPPSPPSAEIPPSPPPDGGLDAWLQVFGSWCVLVITWGLVNSFGVFQTYYETDPLLHASDPSLSSSQISWIGSLQAALLMWVGVVSGPLYDAGYFRLQLVAGEALVVVGMFMTSLCRAYYQLILAQGICVGLGMGLIFLPSTAILSQFFARRRALAIGLASTGSPLAGIVLPVTFSTLQPRVGFGWATRVIAFILLALALPPIAFMHYRVRPTGKRSGFDRSIPRDVPYLALVAGAAFFFLTMYVVFFYIELFDLHYGLSDIAFAPYTVTMLNVGSVFGRVIPNFLADKLGSLNILAVCSIVSAILVFGWFGLVNLAGVIVFALLYGLFSGAIVSLLPSAVMTLTPDLRFIGIRMGVTFLFTGVSILVGTPIAGAILGDGSVAEWRAVIGYTAAGLAVGSCFFALSRYLRWKTKGGIKA